MFFSEYSAMGGHPLLLKIIEATVYINSNPNPNPNFNPTTTTTTTTVL